MADLLAKSAAESVRQEADTISWIKDRFDQLREVAIFGAGAHTLSDGRVTRDFDADSARHPAPRRKESRT